MSKGSIPLTRSAADPVAHDTRGDWDAGTFVTPGPAIPVPSNGCLLIFGGSATGTGYVLKAKFRAGGTDLTININTSQQVAWPVDGRVFTSVSQTAGPDQLSYMILPRDLAVAFNLGGISTVRLQTSPISKIEAQSDATEADFVSVAPAVINAATVETVEAAGVNNSVLGGYMNIVLSMEGAIATVADQLTYVAVKGATSGRYYAVCFAPGQLTARIDTPFTPEKLNIVARNQDTVGHGFAGSIELAAP